MSEHEKKYDATAPRGTKKIDAKTLEKVKELRAKGYSLKKLAMKLKVSKSTVHNYLTGKAQPYTDEEAKIVRSLTK